MEKKENEVLEIADFGWDAILGKQDEPIYIGWLKNPADYTKNQMVAWAREENRDPLDSHNFVPWNGAIGPTWDISIQEYNIRDRKETRVQYCGTIFRNRVKFLSHWYNDRNFAWNDLNMKLSRISAHPLQFHRSAYAKDMEGRKIWFRSQPGVIERWLGSDEARVLIVPETGTKFSCPNEYRKDFLNPDEYYEDGDVITSIFDPYVWWFREDDPIHVPDKPTAPDRSNPYKEYHGTISPNLSIKDFERIVADIISLYTFKSLTEPSISLTQLQFEHAILLLADLRYNTNLRACDEKLLLRTDLILAKWIGADLTHQWLEAEKELMQCLAGYQEVLHGIIGEG